MKLIQYLKANKNIFSIFFLFLIFIIALIFRVYALGDMPSGFHRDEVISGYVGRFIIENGKDIYGNAWPLLYVDKYGDYPPAIPMYLSGISTYFFGVNAFATRLPIAIFGALLLFPLYFLALELFRDKRVAFFSIILMALLPWNIVLSRSTAEGIPALFVIVTGLLFLMKFVKKPHVGSLITVGILFALAYLLYPSYRVFVPLLLLPIPFLFKLKKNNKLLLIGMIVFFIGLTLAITSTSWGKGRFDQTSMFGAQSGEMIRAQIQILAAEEGQNNVSTVKAFHNKVVVYSTAFINQYLTYFSPQYLFSSGGLPYRYVVSNQGVIYLIMLPLLLLAFIYLRDMQKRIGMFLLYLLVISPMPAPLTLDDVPNVHRTFFMVVPLTFLASYGLFAVVDRVKNKKIVLSVFLMIGIVLLMETIYFMHMYYHHANAVKSVERGDTNKEVMQALVSQHKNYTDVYMPVHDAAPIYFLFYSNNFDASLIGKVHKNLRVKKLNNITFSESNCPSKTLNSKDFEKNILVIDYADCPVNPKLKQTQEFSRHDGTKSYRFSIPNIQVE